jgi:hypothetical protein
LECSILGSSNMTQNQHPSHLTLDQI